MPEILRTIRDWRDDEILIDVKPDGTAAIRFPHLRMFSNEWLPVPQRLAQVRDLIAGGLYYRKFAVNLWEGAEWQPEWGNFGVRPATR